MSSVDFLGFAAGHAAKADADRLLSGLEETQQFFGRLPSAGIDQEPVADHMVIVRPVGR
jgi:hypothetical protein